MNRVSSEDDFLDMKSIFSVLPVAERRDWLQRSLLKGVQEDNEVNVASSDEKSMSSEQLGNGPRRFVSVEESTDSKNTSGIFSPGNTPSTRSEALDSPLSSDLARTGKGDMSESRARKRVSMALIITLKK